MKKGWLLICLVILGCRVYAQELRCNISVSTQKIQGTNKELFTNMQRDMYEFVNNKRWSSNVFPMMNVSSAVCNLRWKNKSEVISSGAACR